VTPAPAGTRDGETQQQAVSAVSERDCFNWGYDPVHFTAPEGSYATDPADGAVRIVEFRRMVQALHRAGLRVGMDVVYNHTYASGQDRWSVLDRIVPGYYHRLDEAGRVATSTCCANTGDRAPHDGEAHGRLGGDLGARVPDRLVPLRPDGAPARAAMAELQSPSTPRPGVMCC